MRTRTPAMTLAALFLGLAAVPNASAQLASVGDPVPLLFGTERAKVLYTVPLVRSNANVATCVSCTSTLKSTSIGLTDLVAFEVFFDGTRKNDLTAGEGIGNIDYGGDTEMLCTRAVASVSGEFLMGTAAEVVSLGAGRVVATTSKLICTAFLVPVSGDPPGFMTMLPMYKGTKQKGGM